MPPKDEDKYEMFRIQFPYWDLIRILRMLKNFEAKDVNIYYEGDEWKMTFYVKKPQGVLHSESVKPSSTNICPIPNQDIVNITQGVSN